MKSSSIHIPVMLNESILAMDIDPNGSYVDATFGFGGHSNEILNKLDKKGKLFAIDKDSKAVDLIEKAILDASRFTLKHG